MVHSSSHIALEKVSLTYQRFEFRGLHEPGYCHLKIDTHNDVPVFLCTSLGNIFGRSIEKGSAAVRRRAIGMLCDEGLVTSTRRHIPLTCASALGFEERQRRDVVEFFDQHSIWVHHYPAEIMYSGKDLYKIVNFFGCVSPSVGLSTVVEKTGIDKAFFIVPIEELNFGRG